MGAMARRMFASYSKDATPAEMIEQVNKVGDNLGPEKQQALLALLADPKFATSPTVTVSPGC